MALRFLLQILRIVGAGSGEQMVQGGAPTLGFS